MNVLFLHHNYPAQFRYLAAALAAPQGNKVVFLTEHQRRDVHLPKVVIGQVPVPVPPTNTNLAERNLLHILRRGEAFGNAMLQLRQQGFTPDVMYDHCGWGCGTFAKDIFSSARRISYFEWFFNKENPESMREQLCTGPPALFATHRLRNQCQLDALVDCDVAVSPTHWQRSQYPAALQQKIRVIHDGIDTDFFPPPHKPVVFMHEAIPALATAREIVTYSTRGFEPCRGFPQLFRSLPAILAARPDCQIVIMGDDRVVYDAPRPDGRTWLQAMRAEVDVDPSRVHILPFSAYLRYKNLLQSSSVHIYLTESYVLSWSLLEAMSSGCLVVASDTAPVREVMRHGVNGLLVPFMNAQALAQQVIAALDQKEQLAHFRTAARQHVVDAYGLSTVLPRHLQLVHNPETRDIRENMSSNILQNDTVLAAASRDEQKNLRYVVEQKG